jgi:hypothetical protein
MTLQIEDGSEFAFSRGISALAGVLIPLAISIRTIKSYSDPDRSRKCALSLSLVVGCWTLSSAVYALHLLSSSFEMLALTAAIAICGVDIAGIVIAILGLLEVAGDHRKPLLGRGQAVWALILAPASLAGIAYGVTHPAEPFPKDWRLETSRPGMKASYGSKKFLFRIPAEEWVQLQPQKVSPVATLAFAHPKHRVFFVLIAQPIPPGATLTLDKLAEAARADFLKLNSERRVGDSQPESVGGLEGIRFSAVAPSPKGKLLSYSVWVGSTDSFAYELVTWGEERSADTVLQDATEMMKGFELISP